MSALGQSRWFADVAALPAIPDNCHSPAKPLPDVVANECGFRGGDLAELREDLFQRVTNLSQGRAGLSGVMVRVPLKAEIVGYLAGVPF
jgi:hypothetical protein